MLQNKRKENTTVRVQPLPKLSNCRKSTSYKRREITALEERLIRVSSSVELHSVKVAHELIVGLVILHKEGGEVGEYSARQTFILGPDSPMLTSHQDHHCEATAAIRPRSFFPVQIETVAYRCVPILLWRCRLLLLGFRVARDPHVAVIRFQVVSVCAHARRQKRQQW